MIKTTLLSSVDVELTVHDSTLTCMIGVVMFNRLYNSVALVILCRL